MPTSGSDLIYLSSGLGRKIVGLRLNNDGTLTRNELAGATRVDIRIDLPNTIRVGDLVEVQDNAGNGVSKRVVQADLESGSISFQDAFPLPAVGLAALRM